MIISKIQRFFFQRGRLTFFGKILCVIIGFGLIYISLAFSPNIFVLTLGLSAGFVLVALVTYSNKAESLDLPPPFTNDPLGWRKAKQSYKTEYTPADELNTKDKP